MAVKPTAPTPALPPLRSLGEEDFVIRTEGWFTFQYDEAYPFYSASLDYIEETNTDIQAAAVAANVFDVPLTGLADALIGVNATEDGFEGVEITEYDVSVFSEGLLSLGGASDWRSGLGLGGAAVVDVEAGLTDSSNVPTSAAVINYVEGEVGGLVDSWSHTTNVSQVVLSGLSDWDNVTIEINVTCSDNIFARVSFDGGSTFEVSGYDSLVGDHDSRDESSASLLLSRGSANECRGHITLTSMSGGGKCVASALVIDEIPNYMAGTCPSGAVDAIRIQVASGDIVGGTIKVFGNRRA